MLAMVLEFGMDDTSHERDGVDTRYIRFGE